MRYPRKEFDMRSQKFGLVLVVLLLLCGCGQKAPQLPTEYTDGKDILPAIQELLTLSEDTVEFSQDQESDDGEVSYTYSGLESGSEAVSEYVSLLEKNENCSVIDDKGEIQNSPDFSEKSGTVLVGRQSTDGDGVFSLEITWDEDSCTISPVYQEGVQVHEVETEEQNEELSLNEIVDRFEACSPSSLGLSGESMSQYSVYPEEGYVMVNGKPGIRVNIYEKSTHKFQKTYIMLSDGSRIYQLDRKTNQITEVAL